jgi:hypothetical protein
MLSLLNLKFEDKKKKKTSRKIKILTKRKGFDFLKQNKVKVSKKKKFFLKNFFVENNSLEYQNNLILPLLKLRELNLDSLDSNNIFEVKKATFSLIKLSQILKMGSKFENSLDILPFFFQESFLVSSPVEKMKRKNALCLGNKSLLLNTGLKKSTKKEKVFKRKKKKTIRSKRKVFVLKKTFVKGNEKPLSVGLLAGKKGVLFPKAKKLSAKSRRNVVVVATKSPFLGGKGKEKVFPFRAVVGFSKASAGKRTKKFSNVGESMLSNTSSSSLKKKEKTFSLKQEGVSGKSKPRKITNKGLKVEETFVKKLSSPKVKKEGKNRPLKAEGVSVKTEQKGKRKKPFSPQEKVTEKQVSSKKK